MKTKKIIAREFLFLLAVPIIGLIIAFYYGAKRSYYGSKIEKQKENLTELKLKYQDLKSIDLVNRINGIDQKYLNEYVAHRDNGAYAYEYMPEEITEKIKQSIYDYYATIYNDRDSLDFRIETDIKFPEFFLILKPLEDSVLAFQKERETIKKNLELLERDNRGEDWEIIWTWIFVTLFGLRYLIYATIWAIKTLRTKEE